MHNDVLIVHKIGNYNISIAKSVDEVLNKINWNIFNKPVDLNERIKVLTDKNIHKFDECCFVVAQATKSIHKDGFGIVYKKTNKKKQMISIISPNLIYVGFF